MPDYITLKARISNLANAEAWSHDQVDTVAHPEYLDPEWWKDQPFTVFVWCPFDVTKGGFRGQGGVMNFGDFYPAEHSADGHMWSFLSRSETKLWKVSRFLSFNFSKNENSNPFAKEMKQRERWFAATNQHTSRFSLIDLQILIIKVYKTSSFRVQLFFEVPLTTPPTLKQE